METREVLLTADEIAVRIELLADQVAAVIDNEWMLVCLLTGGIWFAADLSRALARRGCDPIFDALWLSSYGDERRSSTEVSVRADLQRPASGLKVVILDDVLDSGLSLETARAVLNAKGAATIRTAVFARKPWPGPRLIPDFVAWEAPARFLGGYGLDAAGRLRGCPDIVALDDAPVDMTLLTPK